MYITEMLLNFLLPKSCFGCGKVGNYICETCSNKQLSLQYLQRCHVCKNETFLALIHRECSEQSYLDGVVVCYFYNDFIERIVKEIKYKYFYSITADVAKLMQRYFVNYHLRIDVVTAVPLSGFKKRKRGFNQAELIARHLSKGWAIPYIELLSRSRNTQTQVGKSQIDRTVNLLDAFAVNLDKSMLNINSVLLIDDVMTTGTTLEQCAKTLKQRGVEKVYGFVFARGS